MGLFGLVAAALIFALYAAGLDFYAFATRELLRAEPAARPLLLRDQLVFHLLAYLVVLPACLALFAGGLLPWRLAALFLPLLVCEHLGQELQRVLITLSRPLAAALVVFLRGAAWVPPLLLLFFADGEHRRIETVLAAWLAGSAAGLLLALAALRDLPWRRARGPVDWRWLGGGVRVAVPFLVGTLALRGVFTVDRFSLEAVRGTAEVGVYIFFLGVYAAFQGFVEMGVLMVHRPAIIRSFQQGRHDEYRARMRRLALALGGLSLALAAAAALLIGPVLALVGEPLYRQHLPAFWLVLALCLAAAAAELPHLALYARQRDAAIIAASLGGLLLAAAADPWLAARAGPAGVALGTLLAVLLVAAVKIWRLWSGPEPT